MSVRVRERSLSPNEYWMHYVDRLYPAMALKLSHVPKRRQPYSVEPLMAELTQIYQDIAKMPFLPDSKKRSTAIKIQQRLLDLEPLLFKYWSLESVAKRARRYQTGLINRELQLLRKIFDIPGAETIEDFNWADERVQRCRRLQLYTVTKLINAPGSVESDLIDAGCTDLVYLVYKQGPGVYKQAAGILRSIEPPILRFMVANRLSERVRTEWIDMFMDILQSLESDRP